MLITYSTHTPLKFVPCLLFLALFLSPSPVFAGRYTSSGHGNSTNGVFRSSVSDYATGNCTHCHEQHNSIGGQEPAPVNVAPSPFALYTENFNTSATTYPYDESDTICFSCHNESGSVMQITNYNFIQTYADYNYTNDPTYTVDSILEAFTPYPGYTHSEHNLKDVYTYANANFEYFTDSSNPCDACHNPHLARMSNSDVDDPTLTAISKPSDHDSLVGDDTGETMKDVVGANTYQPPYSYGSTLLYEPGAIINHDGSKMPDYNTFCLDCHQNEVPATNTVSSNPNTTVGYLTAIDWSFSGDMHGGAPRFGAPYPTAAGATLKEPYDTTLAATSPNYALSCLDCHEPHGTVLQGNSYLLRKMMNGARVEGTTSGPAQLKIKEWNWSYLNVCGTCHNIGLHCGSDVGCNLCHYHGSTVNVGCTQSWENNKAF